MKRYKDSEGSEVDALHLDGVGYYTWRNPATGTNETASANAGDWLVYLPNGLIFALTDEAFKGSFTEVE